MSEDKYLMRSLDNALQLMDVLAQNDRVTLAELQKLSGFSKASLFKTLYTLSKNGYVEKSKSARYSLSTKFARYGNLVLDRIDLLRVSKDYLQSLCDELNETVHLTMLTTDMLNVVFLAKIEASAERIIKMNSRVGLQIPSYCTSSGKAMLASYPEEQVRQAYGKFSFRRYTQNTITSYEALMMELDIIRSRGYAMDNEEREEGLVCVGAAVHNISGEAVGAISVSGARQHMHSNASVYSQKVLEASHVISDKMGYSRQSD